MHGMSVWFNKISAIVDIAHYGAHCPLPFTLGKLIKYEVNPHGWKGQEQLQASPQKKVTLDLGVIQVAVATKKNNKEMGNNETPSMSLQTALREPPIPTSNASYTKWQLGCMESVPTRGNYMEKGNKEHG